MKFNIAKAVECYYGQMEIGISEIREIYCCGTNKAIQLKKQVQKYQVENDIMFIDSRKVSTKAAFKCWNINIREITHNYKKLLSLGLLEKKNATTGTMPEAAHEN